MQTLQARKQAGLKTFIMKVCNVGLRLERTISIAFATDQQYVYSQSLGGELVARQRVSSR